VPEVILDLPDIDAVEQKMRREAMPLMPRAA
jgi:hypothetical protein